LSIENDSKKVDPTDDESFNKLFPYDAYDFTDWRINKNVIKVNPVIELERKLTQDRKDQLEVEAQPELISKRIAKEDADFAEKIKAIAFNSREVRLVGPNQKEVEMKDDVASRLLVALENFQKDATQVWGQVNGQLDKGWTDFKTMIEDAVASAKKSTASRQLRETIPFSDKPSSLVVVRDGDGYSIADSESAAQTETTGDKVKGFLSNIGLTDENQKKASDALTKAGASVSDTVTKDLPDALKKAGTVVSDTVTKDIPDAFKNFFG